MPLLVTGDGSGFEIMEAGQHIGRCYSIVFMGTMINNFGKKSAKVRISFEFPTELKVFKEEDGEQPYVLSRSFTHTIHPDSHLGLNLMTWRGKPFTPDELAGFDLYSILSVPALINVVHKEHNNKTYANIATIGPVPKGMNIPPQINDNVMFDFSDNFSEDILNGLPEFMQKDIMASEEYRALQTAGDVIDTTPGPEYKTDENELPF